MNNILWLWSELDTNFIKTNFIMWVSSVIFFVLLLSWLRPFVFHEPEPYYNIEEPVIDISIEELEESKRLSRSLERVFKPNLIFYNHPSGDRYIIQVEPYENDLRRFFENGSFNDEKYRDFLVKTGLLTNDAE